MCDGRLCGHPEHSTIMPPLDSPLHDTGYPQRSITLSMPLLPTVRMSAMPSAFAQTSHIAGGGGLHAGNSVKQQLAAEEQRREPHVTPLRRHRHIHARHRKDGQAPAKARSVAALAQLSSCSS
jgi:hypothetical protein